ncbi:hypothetical protein GCM10009792_25260 [Microcella alkalica]|uniref:Uncharacterized protein HemX n=1 Tax=Microcella alkalica TaxID=355930 RepID=A0A839E698_9MICO|nr:hypothetical protein [Microcella alkalica]MBA8846836.1 uncharacterized protein HemX [Microcella alkalica]
MRHATVSRADAARTRLVALVALALLLGLLGSVISAPQPARADESEGLFSLLDQARNGEGRSSFERVAALDAVALEWAASMAASGANGSTWGVQPPESVAAQPAPAPEAATSPDPQPSVIDREPSRAPTPLPSPSATPSLSATVEPSASATPDPAPSPSDPASVVSGSTAGALVALAVLAALVAVAGALVLRRRGSRARH